MTTFAATASDNVGVAGVQFVLDGVNLGAEDAAAPYSLTVDTATLAEGSHVLTAVARDAAGNSTTSVPVSFSIANQSSPCPLGEDGLCLPGALINAGGPGVSPFAADLYYAGGTPATNYQGVIDTLGVQDAAPEAIYHSERWGAQFSYTIPDLTPSSPYSVRLHFAENYWTSAGQRVFDVAINGAAVLSSFDVFAAAGAAHRAHVREFTVTADAQGSVVIAFTARVNMALVNGVEVQAPVETAVCGDGVLEGAEQCDEGAANGGPETCCSAACTLEAAGTMCRDALGACDIAETCDGASPSCPPAEDVLCQPDALINAGGPDVSPFAADLYYAGGTPATNYQGVIDTLGVQDAAPEAIYHSERWGAQFSYTIPDLTPSSPYSVRLHFAENYWTSAGQRVFDVAINGAAVLSSFDVFAAAGAAHRAHVREFIVTADAQGSVVIAFTARVNMALVNGVEVQASLEVLTCGDGVLAGAEQCDEGAANGSAGSCCSATCTLKAAGTTCRESTGAGDLAEACDGASPSCPPDSGTVCLPPPSLTAGGAAVPTFESLGLYWTPPSNPGSAGCQVRFREANECTWREGLPMWYDTRTIGGRSPECRGSLVHLAPGTTYVVQFGMPGQPFSRELTATTWSESFPIGEIVYLPNGTSSTSLSITSGGTAGGYKLYTFPPGGQSTIDVANGADTNITISAPYVIIRGLTLRGARWNAIQLNEGAHDIVIEDNDISGWGRIDSDAGSAGASSVVWGMNGDAGVYSTATSPERIVIQRNEIHHPRTDSNSWGEYRAKYSTYHPRGPQGIYLVRTAGNIVIRHNDFYTDADHMFNDVMGGDENFSDRGFPNRDADIYGNYISHGWDDAVESEGANRNVRIWGNYIDQTTTGIATSSTSVGPLYIWRNVYNRSRYNQMVPLDSDGRLYFGKSGDVGSWGGGRRYYFHNTLLQAPPPPGSTRGLGAGMGIAGNGTDRPISNTVSRNNIWHIWVDHWASINTYGGANNDCDYDLYNGTMSANYGAQAHGIAGKPTYQSGHGWASCLDTISCTTGAYQLAPGSSGHDSGARLPNFNDDYLGAAPDMGAHETGSAFMRFGRLR